MPPRVSGILGRSCSTAMKMPPPGGTSSGSGGGRGAGGTLGREGRGSHSPSRRAQLGKSRPAARAGLEGKDLLTARCCSFPKPVGTHPEQDGLEIDNLCVFSYDCKQWNKTRI